MSKKLALNYLMGQMWALDASVLFSMGNIANREFTESELSDVFDTKPDALAGKYGDKTDTELLTMRDNVAIISVSGVISRYTTFFQLICGGTSTDMLAKAFTKAIQDSSIRSIILDIDSPGGEAQGIHELSEMIYSARGKKPITAYIGGIGASAAYWIASAADEIVMDATAMVGSIGVVSTIKRKKSSDNIETLEIVSTQSPNKRLDPFTEDGQAEFQARIDEFADIFIDKVARNRGVSRQKVLDDFGKGGVLLGKAAVKNKMASRLGSLEGVISELKTGRSMATTTRTEVESGEIISSLLPTTEHLTTALFVTALNEERPDVVEAMKPIPEPTALSVAADIAKACADAGIPALSASLLKEGVTKAQAETKIKMASDLKDKLVAAGLSLSFETIFAQLDDPIAMVGLAIHEAQAAKDESSESSRHIVTGGGTENKINAADIYAKRKGKK